MFGRSRGAGGAARPRAARVTLAAATPQVSESALVAHVAGGSPRAVSRANAELELDASASHDPDGCGTAALQAGACSAQESGVAVAWACALRSDPKRACRARGTGAIARLRGGARLRLDVGALDVDAEDAIVLSAVVSKVRPPRPARAGAAASHARTGAGLSGPPAWSTIKNHNVSQLEHHAHGPGLAAYKSPAAVPARAHAPPRAVFGRRERDSRRRASCWRCRRRRRWTYSLSRCVPCGDPPPPLPLFPLR